MGTTYWSSKLCTANKLWLVDVLLTAVEVNPVKRIDIGFHLHGTQKFVHRIIGERRGEACGYYGALVDSIELTISLNNPKRVKVEEALLRKIANSVACEGKDHVERCEAFGKWRAQMSMVGFKLKASELNRCRVNLR
ncbi:hypothetical protein GOBAR_AA37643 [Gossypium barbadense]|uniref:Uncharacterized protein n=1 Tax=Gossypium barbadense TaxID=3634 RepID=A0A2P5VW77_GOSBA|nr:hypothetical protein GOBAR_AA37643 [Gossypium barbadense]